MWCACISATKPTYPDQKAQFSSNHIFKKGDAKYFQSLSFIEHSSPALPWRKDKSFERLGRFGLKQSRKRQLLGHYYYHSLPLPLPTSTPSVSTVRKAKRNTFVKTYNILNYTSKRINYTHPMSLMQETNPEVLTHLLTFFVSNPGADYHWHFNYLCLGRVEYHSSCSNWHGIWSVDY